MENVGIFHGRKVNFVAIWAILCLFGLFYGYLVYFPPFRYIVPRKNLATLLQKSMDCTWIQLHSSLKQLHSTAKNTGLEVDEISNRPALHFITCNCVQDSTCFFVANCICTYCCSHAH
jgi:hypothetical protein